MSTAARAHLVGGCWSGGQGRQPVSGGYRRSMKGVPEEDICGARGQGARIRWCTTHPIERLKVSMIKPVLSLSDLLLHIALDP
jgi:hypothetical protein